MVVFFVGHTGTHSGWERPGYGLSRSRRCPSHQRREVVTAETFKEFSKRSPSKHTLLIINAPFEHGSHCC